MEEFNLFNDVNHAPLRVYNRAVFAFNILEDAGKEKLKEYLQSFTEDERLQIFLMVNYIRINGKEKAQKFATQGLVLDDDA